MRGVDYVAVDVVDVLVVGTPQMVAAFDFGGYIEGGLEKKWCCFWH